VVEQPCGHPYTQMPWPWPPDWNQLLLPSMTLDQFLTAAVSFLTASVVLTLWRVSTAEESSNQ